MVALGDTIQMIQKIQMIQLIGIGERRIRNGQRYPQGARQQPDPA